MFFKKKKKYYSLLATFNPVVGIGKIDIYWKEMEKINAREPFAFQNVDNSLWGYPTVFQQEVNVFQVDKRFCLTEKEVFERIGRLAKGKVRVTLHPPKGC